MTNVDRAPEPVISESVLSICIGSRNRANFLARHLAHIAGFKKLKYEVVVSDNCSDDNTPEMLANARKEMPNLVTIRQPEPLSFKDTVSAACALAAGDYMMFVADDDLLQEDGLVRAMTLLDRHHDVAAVYGSWNRLDPLTNTVVDHVQKVKLDTYYSREDMVRLYEEQGWPELPVFRRAVYHATHIPLPYQLPFDLYGAALFSRYGDLALIPDALVNVTQHEGQESRGIYEVDKIYGHISDVELFLGEVSRMAGTPDMARKIGHQYLWCATRAIEDGHYLLARQYILKARAYLPEIALTGAVDFQKTYLVQMLAEALSQFYTITRPTRRLICDTSEDCAVVSAHFAQRHPEVEVIKLDIDQFIARPPHEEDLYLTATPNLMAHREETHGIPTRKFRTVPHLIAACQLILLN